MKSLRWVQPSTVVDIAFVEWTGEGLLRHSRFVALRKDTPTDVRREPAQTRWLPSQIRRMTARRTSSNWARVERRVGSRCAALHPMYVDGAIGKTRQIGSTP